jgi:hypothetical protein
VIALPTWSSCRLLLAARCGRDGGAGEAQEHVVEVGWRRATSSMRMPAWSSSRTAATSAVEPPLTGTPMRPAGGVTWGWRPVARCTAAAAAVSACGAPSTTSSRSPPIWLSSCAGVPSAIIWPASMTAIRSASWSASSRYWVVSRTVVPPATRVRMLSQTSLRLRGSSPVVGSSRNSTGGAMAASVERWRPPARSRG